MGWQNSKKKPKKGCPTAKYTDIAYNHIDKSKYKKEKETNNRRREVKLIGKIKAGSYSSGWHAERLSKKNIIQPASSSVDVLLGKTWTTKAKLTKDGGDELMTKEEVENTFDIGTIYKSVSGNKRYVGPVKDNHGSWRPGFVDT